MRLLLILAVPFTSACGYTCGTGTHAEGRTCVVDADDSSDTGGDTAIEPEGPDCTAAVTCDGHLRAATVADLSTLSLCDTVNGDIEVINGNITDLSPLGCTRVLNGHLSISENSELVDFSGLEKLEEISGEVLVQENPALEDVSALGNLTYATDVHIRRNQALLAVEWPALFHVRDELDITGNDVLHSLSFPSLHHLTGTLRISGNPSLCQSQADAVYDGISGTKPSETFLVLNQDGC